MVNLSSFRESGSLIVGTWKFEDHLNYSIESSTAYTNSERVIRINIITSIDLKKRLSLLFCDKNIIDQSTLHISEDFKFSFQTSFKDMCSLFNKLPEI